MESVAPTKRARKARRPPKKRTRRQRIQLLDRERANIFYAKHPYLKRKDPLGGPSGMTEEEQIELAVKESRKLSRKRSRGEKSESSDFDSAEELRKLDEARWLQLAAYTRTRRRSPPGTRGEFPPSAFARNSTARETYNRVEDFKRPGARWSTGFHPANRNVAAYGQPIHDLSRETDMRRIEIIRKIIHNLNWFAANMEAAHERAKANLVASFVGKPNKRNADLLLSVANQEWGTCALEMTRRHGFVFAVLNMANDRIFGGYYMGASSGQEEDMFRRTDCHFHDEGRHVADKYYSSDMRALVNGTNGTVYLDVKNPRVCAFDRRYDQYDPADYFSFYELRSAPQDCSIDSRTNLPHNTFNAAMCRQKIVAQLETLVQNNVAHVVLSAFGCEKFGNPSEVVARIYKEEIQRRRQYFSVITFAIPDRTICAVFLSIF